ncbi:MAG: HNH endonuclease [Kineosporiaceae bacterium]|nr:HNH endonuclease [Kineosporiaceae bacterium]
MGSRFNPPPGWPAPPEGWRPTPNWIPDPSWPAPPVDWEFWLVDDGPRPAPSPQAEALIPQQAGPHSVTTGAIPTGAIPTATIPTEPAMAQAIPPAAAANPSWAIPSSPPVSAPPAPPLAAPSDTGSLPITRPGTDSPAGPLLASVPPQAPPPGSLLPAPDGWPLSEVPDPSDEAEDPLSDNGMRRKVLAAAAAAAVLGTSAVALWMSTRPEASEPISRPAATAAVRSAPTPSGGATASATPSSGGASSSPGAGAGVIPQDATAALSALITRTDQATTPYLRSAFGTGWGDPDGNGCDTGNDVLARDLTSTKRAGDHCVVTGGRLLDPYVGRTVTARSVSGTIALDFVVPLADAWTSGAHAWTDQQRRDFLDDARNVQAVQASTTAKKRNRDASGYIPSSVRYRCTYIARQIGLKYHYRLTVSDAERAVMTQVLTTCPNQSLPTDLRPSAAIAQGGTGASTEPETLSPQIDPDPDAGLDGDPAAPEVGTSPTPGMARAPLGRPVETSPAAAR